MKRSHIYGTVKVALIAIVLSLSSSCQKAIFEEPYASLTPETAFQTADRVEKSAIGMYNALQNGEYLGGRVLIYADIRGTDVNPPSYFGAIPQFTSVTSGNATVELAWQGAYATIGQVNLFMKNLAATNNVVSPAKADQYNGEAKFIRALSYFYLVNLWAQPYKFTPGATHLGVPLALTVASNPLDSESQLPRATVAAVYAQMEQDLLDAEAKLPNDYQNPAFFDVARATKNAARALLARVYLYKGDYPNALIYANKVIDADRYDLNGDPATAFRNFTTRESIFSVAMNLSDNPNTNNAIGQHYSETARGDINISSEHIALLDQTKDLRFKNLIKPSGGAFWTTKYPNIESWVPVLRYAEILLIKAEAMANIAPGLDTQALALVNELRDRSDADPVAPTTKQALIDAILVERRLELAFEGQGSFDYLRTGRGIPEHSVVLAQAYGSDYVVLPIPLYETQKNPKLVPNPGY